MDLHVTCQPTNWTFKWSVRGYCSQIFRTDYFSKHQVMDLEHNIFLPSILISFLQKNRSCFPRSEPKSLHITLNTIVSCHCLFYEVCCSIRFLAVFSWSSTFWRDLLFKMCDSKQIWRKQKQLIFCLSCTSTKWS